MRIWIDAKTGHILNVSKGLFQKTLPLHHRPFFHSQILIQHRRSDLSGIEVESERALIAETGQQQFAPCGQLLRG